MPFNVDGKGKRYQIRVRTDEKFDEIKPIQDWLQLTGAGFAFHHNKPNNNHYHIYLFDLDRDDDSLRKTLGRYYRKQDYSVKKTAGKERAYIVPCFAWQYATTEQYLEPVWIKGFTPKQEQEFRDMAHVHYDTVNQPQEVVNVVREEHYIVRPDRVWERLVDNRDKYDGLNVKQIKSKLVAEWLNAGKAMPRPSDLHRYAVSLYLRQKYKDGEVPDEAYSSYVTACE